MRRVPGISFIVHKLYVLRAKINRKSTQRKVSLIRPIPNTRGLGASYLVVKP